MLTASPAHFSKVLNIMPSSIRNAIQYQRLRWYWHSTDGRQHPSHAGGEVITLVAELSCEVVGFIDARLEQSPDAMHREMIYCHIAEIAVRTGYRNQDIGRRLLRAAEDWGRQLGAEFASMEYHAANTRASLFYQERIGYSLASVTAIKRL